MADHPPTNPLQPTEPLQPPGGPGGATPVEQLVHPQKEILPEDSAVTKAEKLERHGETATKRIKLDGDPPRERVKGVTPIKPEFLIHRAIKHEVDDDAAEAAPRDQRDERRKKKGGQNKGRKHTLTRDEVGLCTSRANHPEFSPGECQFGSDCKFEHDLRKYLKEWKREDLTTFGGLCPIFQAYGRCDSGWKCRFVGSHMVERETEKGNELILKENPHGDTREQTLNNVGAQAKIDLAKRKIGTPKADEYSKWLDEDGKVKSANANGHANGDDAGDNRATYVEAPFRPSEKRKIYFGRETPVLAPLTTQGNLPFRRLCVSLGAQATYSEMAMSLPLIQGSKSEWALMRAHVSETEPPAMTHGTVVQDYDHAKDSKFGAQIAANKPWQAMKATEVLTSLCPQLRVVDLNCGCPIDLVYRTGAGSGLLDSPGKLEKMLRGMNAVSGEVPITVKIRMGTKDNRPTATKLIDRLIHGGEGAHQFKQGSCGVAAITLHGRSRQQRYTRSADWQYIADCADMIRRYNEVENTVTDTSRAPDERDQAANGKVYFLGNGDCYSHTDYFEHLDLAKVDAVMVARGALIKPWIFEEISTGQYLDKSATERLAYVEKFVKNGLEVWGSDERGVGLTRRFLLEWLNFAHRYVPIGLLEHLPPNIQDRPPAWQGRNELETLLGSDDYKDWIKISEMFLGPAHKDFNFVPKHKSNSYEIEAEG